jgi:hypothetical protein
MESGTHTVCVPKGAVMLIRLNEKGEQKVYGERPEEVQL